MHLRLYQKFLFFHWFFFAFIYHIQILPWICDLIHDDNNLFLLPSCFSEMYFSSLFFHKDFIINLITFLLIPNPIIYIRNMISQTATLWGGNNYNVNIFYSEHGMNILYLSSITKNLYRPDTLLIKHILTFLTYFASFCIFFFYSKDSFASHFSYHTLF